MTGKTPNSAEALRKIFVAITQDAVQKYPASQYFWDDGTEARHGFVCGGYHLWLEVDTRGENYFKVGPVPNVRVTPTEYLIKGAGTLPWDEVKASMITPKRLQFYWDMLDEQVAWFENPFSWSAPHWWFKAPGVELFVRDNKLLHALTYGNIDSAAGEALYFNIPNGGIIPPAKVALVDATKHGTPAAIFLKGMGTGYEGFKGCVAASHVTNDAVKETYEFTLGEKPYRLRRVGGKFTIQQEDKNMKFNTENIPDVETPTAAAQETTNPPLATAENTNPPVVPAPADKPVITAAPAEGVHEEISLKERLEEAFQKAETLKTLAAEFLKELKPLIKEVGKLEKGAADSAEVKELRAENKTLTAENTRLKGAMKLLVNGDKF